MSTRIRDEDSASEPAGEARGIRLNKFLADHGIASRRHCDQLIASGAVSIDGRTVTELGTRVDPERQKVEVDGVALKPARKRYYLLNKPSGVFCTNDERENRKRAIDLIDDPDKGRIYTVGRLDEETTGIVLLTSDGEFANRVMHPRYGVPKTYLVKLAGFIPEATVQMVRDGVRLSEGKSAGMRVLVQKRSDVQSQLVVTLNEGLNREVRRVFAAVGFKVKKLHRERIGPLSDRGLKVGSWRPLTRAEVAALLDPEDSGARDPKLSRLRKPRAHRARRAGGGPRQGGAPRGAGAPRANGAPRHGHAGRR